jgi:hypothetical protein
MTNLLAVNDVRELLNIFEHSYFTPSNDLKTISGLQEQWKVECMISDLRQREAIERLKLRVVSILERAFVLNGDELGKHNCSSEVLGMRSTVSSKPQCPHADMNHGYGFVIIAYLSSCKSAFFHVDMFEELASQIAKQPEFPENISADFRCTHPSWNRYYRVNFSAVMCFDTTSYRDFEVDAGDVVLFRSDSIHFGPGADALVDRKMLFFTVNRAQASSYNVEEQLQPWVVAEKLYGRNSEIWKGCMRDSLRFRPLEHFEDLTIKEALGDNEFIERLETELQEGKRKEVSVT